MENKSRKSGASLLLERIRKNAEKNKQLVKEMKEMKQSILQRMPETIITAEVMPFGKGGGHIPIPQKLIKPGTKVKIFVLKEKEEKSKS